MAGNKRSEPTNPVDPSKNIEAAKSMDEALRGARASAQDISDAFQEQLKTMVQLRAAMAQMCNLMNSCATEAVQQGSLLSGETWSEVEKKIRSTTKAQDQYNETLKKTQEKLMKGLAVAVSTASGAITGLGQGFRNLYALGKGVVGIITSATSVIYKFTKAMVMAPFRVIEGLFEMSKGAVDLELARKIEEVRGQFGSLKSESSRTVLDVAKGMGKLNDTGVSAWSLFGNLAERIEAVKKLAMGMGASFQVFQNEIMANGEAIMRYNKGLGITEEMMGGIASTALRMGSSISDIQLDMTKQALGMSKAFGVNAKVISRDMAVAMKDLAHFGHLSTKEIAVAATFANKLGVSVDKLTSILDATKTFDQTAESVSKLNEQFHTNINAQDLMMAESPAEQLQMLRNEFSRAGVDVSKLNRFQRDLIKNTGLMSDELINASLSSKNASVSYHDMAKQSADNAASTMSQRQAMIALADSMERLIKPFEFVAGGILKHIAEGFSRGVQQSKPFMKLMLNMNQVLQESLYFGVKLGHMFVDMFPGVNKILRGLSDMFDPIRYRDMYNKIIDIIKKFSKKGPEAFSDMMKEIKEVFFNFFEKDTAAGQQVLQGLKEFGKAVMTIFGPIAEWVVKELASIIVSITDWLKNPKMPNLGPAAGFAGELLKPLQGAIKALSEKLWPAIKGLGEQLMTMLVDTFNSISTGTKIKIAAVVGGIIFIPAIMGALTGLASGLMAAGAGQVLAQGLSKVVLSALGKVSAAGPLAAAAGGSKGISAVTSSVAAAVPNPAEAAKMEIISKFQIDWPSVVRFLVGLAGVVAIGLGAFFGAILLMRTFNVTRDEIINAGIMFLAVGKSISWMSDAMQSLIGATTIYNTTTEKQILKAFGVLAAVMAVGLGSFMLGILAVRNFEITTDEIVKTAAVFLAAGIVMLAASGMAAIITGIGFLTSKAGVSNVIAGLVATGLIVAAMTGTAWAIIKLSKDVPNAESVKAGALVLQAVADTFLKAGAAVLLAIPVGLSVSSFGGAGAVAAIAGFTAMGLVVAAIAAMAVDTMESFSKIKQDPSAVALLSKSFVEITDSIFKTIDSITKLTDSLDLKRMSQGDIEKTLKSVSDFVSTLIDGKSGEGGIKGIIETVIYGLKTIPLDRVKTAEAFAKVLQAVAEMMNATVTGLQAFSTRGGSRTSISVSVFGNSSAADFNQQEAATAATIIGNMSNYVEKVLGSSTVFMNKMIDALKEIKKPELLEKAGPAIAAVMKSMAEFIHSLTPNLESMKKKTKNYERVAEGEEVTGVDPQVLALTISGITTLLDKMKDVMPGFIKAITSSALDSMAKVSPEKLKMLPAVATIITAVASMISAVTNKSVSFNITQQSESARQASINIDNIGAALTTLPDYNKVFNDIGKTMPAIFAGVKMMANAVPSDTKSFMSNLNVVKESMTVLASIIEALQGSAKIIEGAKGSNLGQNVNNILERMHAVKNVLQGLAAGNWQVAEADQKNTFSLIMTHLKQLSQAIPENFKDQPEIVKKAFEGVAGIVKAITTVNLGEDPAKKKDEIKKVFNEVNDMLGKIAGENPTDVLAPVRRIATKVGFMRDALISLGDTSSLSNDVQNFSKNLNVMTAALGSIAPINDNLIVTLQKVDNNLLQVLGENSALSVGLGGYLGAIMRRVSVFSARGLGQEITTIQHSIAAVDMMRINLAQLEDALMKLPTVDVSAKLDKLADSTGMMVRGKMPVVTGKEVTIHLNLAVYMEAAQVEEVLILRKESLIRDRINFLAAAAEAGPGYIANKKGSLLSRIISKLDDAKDTTIGVIQTNQPNARIAGQGVS